MSVLSLSSCNDWLLESTPGITKTEDFFTSAETALQNVNAAYVPMAWEYNQTYYPEWFIGDVCSDDALKGGQSIGDMAAVYDLENFKINTNNIFLLDTYRGLYQGVARSNLVIEQVGKMHVNEDLSLRLKNRILGEAYFLRALYYFRLVRIFGGVPKIDFVVDSSNNWKNPRATKEEIFEFIIQDLKIAEKMLWQKSEYPKTDLGRATKGAAQAMLLKSNLYIHNYSEAKSWGDSIFKYQEYSLCSNYADNFTLEGENGPESVFEIQYMNDPTSDYGDGNGFTRGTFTIILTRSRSSRLGGGWGFNKPTQNLYDAYETDDPRRDITILNPTDEEIENPSQEIYLGSPYLNNKYSMLDENRYPISLAHQTRGELNNKVIRYSDVLLMYAEACCETGDLELAKSALEKVRKRARHNNTSILLSFPYGNYKDNKEDLIDAIRKERRLELAMEGHRWFDLCRWGIAKKVIDAYLSTETDEVKKESASFIEGKHELFPIPVQEIELDNSLIQNPGYY